jgi:phospholipid/cholesterol/gamma-HCH transport system permease protein
MSSSLRQPSLPPPDRRPEPSGGILAWATEKQGKLSVVMTSAAGTSAALPRPSPRAPPKPHDRPSPSTMAQLGASFLEIAAVAGGMGILAGKIAVRIATLRLDGAEVMRNLYKMGVKSIPIVIVTALFTGAIMVIQAAPLVERFGAHGLLGWGAGFGTLREIAPLLTALMINGRVGANNTAELGTMVVTEQIDALRVLAIDPVSFLIAPRVVAMVTTLLISTIFADTLALVGAAYAGQGLLGVAPMVFFNGLTSGLLGISDVLGGLVKSVVFGVVMALASCHYGLAVKGGAPGVGRGVNATVVASAAGIFILDYLVSFTLD